MRFELVGGNDAKVQTLINSLQMSGGGKHVDLAFTVPPEMLDILNGAAGLKNLHEHQNAPQSPKRK